MAQVYNCTDSPVGLDDGSLIGGRERADVSLTNTVKNHIAAGRLVRVSDQTSDQKPGSPARDTKEK